ncbi:MAG: hypothetical protein ACK5MQ_13445 [Pikeienuella sp.]
MKPFIGRSGPDRPAARIPPPRFSGARAPERLRLRPITSLRRFVAKTRFSGAAHRVDRRLSIHGDFWAIRAYILHIRQIETSIRTAARARKSGPRKQAPDERKTLRLRHFNNIMFVR